MSSELEYINEVDRLDNQILPADEVDDKNEVQEKEDITGGTQPSDLTPEDRASFNARAEEAGIALSSDFDLVLDAMMGLTDEEAVAILLGVISTHSADPNFPAASMPRIVSLVQGYKANDMSESDWSFLIKAEAAIIHFHSPYPEVRSVTSPTDDPSTPCETIRLYVIGVIFIAGSSALNNFFSPRTPSISLGPNVLQLLVYPVGRLAAATLPDWGITIKGSRHSLNPGPWSFKEQVLTVIFFDISNANLYTLFLIQKLPRYLKQDWVSFGYEILLTLSISFLGFAYAGLLRRFAVFPVTALWPSVLPTLALSRTLTVPEKETKSINGWRLSRYMFFSIFTAAMFVWFWVPNFLFQAFHGFNWMTWISPQNFNLANITGFYGGMGYNPWATFDYNVAGINGLTTPFFSTLQSVSGMALSGLIIIGTYYSNYRWTAHMPINANGVYSNEGKIYNTTAVLDAQGNLDPQKYYSYGPPFYTAYGIFQNGQSYAWNTLVVVYIYIRYWPALKQGFKGISKTFLRSQSVYEGYNDAQIRLYRKYKEVPEWWFMVVLLFSFCAAVAALVAWPTQTPWWSLLFTIAFTAIAIIPMTMILAQANITIETTAVLQVLSSVMFPRKPQTLLIFSAFGTNNLDASRSYASDVKLGLYARIPPRTLFRAQMLAVLIKALVFVIMVDWITTSFDVGTLCTTENPDHFVCNAATQQYGIAIAMGMMGAPVMFKLYPILPWCFLIGGLIGLVWAVVETRGPRIREMVQRRCRETTFWRWNTFLFRPIQYMGMVNPTIMWSGAHNWGGASNLSYNINRLYCSFIFMFYIKRRYPAWWEKYNYLLEMAFTCGVALSGLIITLASKFGPHPISAPVWWGNTVSTAGIDFAIYNSKAALLMVPKGEHFGPAPDQLPSAFGKG